MFGIHAHVREVTHGLGIEKRAAAIDRLSAVILLQSYLDSLAYTRPEEPV